MGLEALAFDTYAYYALIVDLICPLGEVCFVFFNLVPLNSSSKEAEYSSLTSDCFSAFVSYPTYLLLFSFAIANICSAISFVDCTVISSFNKILQRSTLILAAMGDLETIFLSLSLNAKRY